MTKILSACVIVDNRCATISVVRSLASLSTILESMLHFQGRVLTSLHPKLEAVDFSKRHAQSQSRCFCPPESFTPRSPTFVSYPRGSVSMKSCAFAAFAAAITSSSDASGFPHQNITFYRITEQNSYPVKQYQSGRVMILLLTSRKSCPSIRTAPPVTS